MKLLKHVAGAAALLLSFVTSVQAQTQSEPAWNAPQWCLYTVVSNEPYTLQSMEILQTMHLPPDEGYGEEVRMRVSFLTDDLYPRRIDAYCSLMDLSGFGNYGGRPQVEVYIPTNTPGQWLLYSFNGLADFSVSFTEPLWDGWIN